MVSCRAAGTQPTDGKGSGPRAQRKNLNKPATEDLSSDSWCFRAAGQETGMAMQHYGLGVSVGLKDLPTLRMRIHRQILT